MTRTDAATDGTSSGHQAPRPSTVVYITGSGRSGSTLLERILGAVPGFVNVGELIDLPRRVVQHDELCGCGAAFSACPFWQGVGARAQGGWDDDAVAELHRLQRRVARQRHLPGLIAPALADERARRDRERYAASYAGIYRAVLAESAARVVVDASKRAAHGLALSCDPAIDLRLIHLVRDARGVAFSWAKTDVQRPQGGAPEATMSRLAPHVTSGRWVALQAEIAAVRRRVTHSTLVRYEDLVADPAATVTRALADVGLALGEDDLRHLAGDTVDLPASHGLSGNPSRMRTGPQRLRLDEQWRRDMPRRDRLVTTAIAALPLARFGYLPVAARSRRTS